MENFWIDAVAIFTAKSCNAQGQLAGMVGALNDRDAEKTAGVHGAETGGSAAWPFVGLSLALLLGAGAFGGEGLGRAGIELGLRLTARLAFVAFWPCYAAGALVVLFGPGLAPLKRRARALGLTFAAVLAVHLGLVFALCAIGAPPSARVFIIFGPGAVCAFLLAAASLKPVTRAIGSRGWWVLRNLAMNYIAFDFVVDFVRREPLNSAGGAVAYLPFAALAAAAPALRLAAFVKQQARRYDVFFLRVLPPAISVRILKTKQN